MAEQAETVIRIEGLTKKFGELTAVGDLNLEVRKGEVFGLVGPDGAGKTTTLRMLCALMDPTEGSAEVAGFNVASNPIKVKDRIGYMAQRFGLYRDLSVNENMDFYADLFGISKQDREELTPRLLEMTRMGPFGERAAGKLSGGMKQKLALMCTLLHKPEILFLDEPTNGVDPVSRRDFWKILYQLVDDGLTVFVTTAYLDEAERCDRVGFMYNGELIRLDTPAGIKTIFEEKCYELACSDLRRAVELLKHQDGVLSAEPAGSVVHLFAKEDVAPPSRLRELLNSEGIEVSRLDPIDPSLEDVFIALVRQSEHGKGGQQ